jgi:hypothetical protein
MDPTKQVYEADATGWQRGLYADIRATLRAPMVNSIWRTLAANAPDFLRYAWGQIKPVFETRAFAAFTVEYRDTILSAVGAELPAYDPAAVDLAPGEFRELAGQMAAFDAVSPRLAVLFALADRRLHGEPVGADFEGSAAATAPFPDWLDADRGRAPTLLPQDESRAAVPDPLADSFGPMVPSVYRCLGQWPSYLERAWTDIEPVLDTPAYERACEDAFALVERHLDRLAYTPRIDPDALAGAGVAAGTVEDLRELFGTFRAGGEAVLPLLPLYAATVGAAGERAAV